MTITDESYLRGQLHAWRAISKTSDNEVKQITNKFQSLGSRGMLTQTTEEPEMTNKTTLIERQKAMQEELNKLAAEISSMPDEIDDGMPGSGKNYFMVTTFGRVSQETASTETKGYSYECDVKACEIGNVFPTREAAEHEVKKRKALAKLKRYNKGYKYQVGVPNFWITIQDKKWIIEAFNHQQHAGVTYFKSKQDAQRAIDEMGDELKVLFE